MSSGKSYNPFSPIGRYNLEVFLYDNKQPILGFTIGFIILFIGLSFFVWSQGTKDPRKPPRIRPPPPKYGYGPYGFGLYAPPREILENPPDVY